MSEKRFCPFRGEKSHQKAVVQQQKSQNEDQIIQKRIIGREDDANLPGRHDEKERDSNSARKKCRPDQDQFESEREERRCGVKPVRQVLHIPADPCWQRSILIILIHRREVPPLDIAASDFCNTGLEVDAEPFPKEHIERHSNKRPRFSQAWPESTGARKSERNPASSNMPSDWYPEKSPAALTNERKHTKQITSIPRGQKLKTSSTAAAMPTQQSVISMCDPLENHKTLGTYQ